MLDSCVLYWLLTWPDAGPENEATRRARPELGVTPHDFVHFDKLRFCWRISSSGLDGLEEVSSSALWMLVARPSRIAV